MQSSISNMTVSKWQSTVHNIARSTALQHCCTIRIFLLKRIREHTENLPNCILSQEYFPLHWQKPFPKFLIFANLLTTIFNMNWRSKRLPSPSNTPAPSLPLPAPISRPSFNLRLLPRTHYLHPPVALAISLGVIGQQGGGLAIAPPAELATSDLMLD